MRVDVPLLPPVSATTLIEPRLHDLGDGFSVRRVLPQKALRNVGPFVFFDHIGPADIAAGRGLDVRPHPHIGLATVTFLYEGAITHRDSLGCEQVIRPGDVNWMTAGRGIVHSERTPPVERAAGHRVHGLQTWLALPREHEETAPAFFHHAAASLPIADEDGVRICVIAGRSFGLESPVRVYTPTLYADVRFAASARLRVDAEHEERALYVIDGDVRVDDVEVPARRMLPLRQGEGVDIRADAAAHVVVCGGAKLDAERFLWWNFVSSSRARIERAKADWQAQRFGSVPGEHEFIPLPDA